MVINIGILFLILVMIPLIFNRFWFPVGIIIGFVVVILVLTRYRTWKANFLVKKLLRVIDKENVVSQKEGGITMDKKIPITPFELIKRMKDVPKILEWSKMKHLTVFGPDFWGTHHIYVDNFLKHIIFCLKADLTTHVFIGIPTGAEEWRRYDENVKLLFSKQINSDFLGWKIYKDIILYKGKMLPPKRIPEEPYWGKVIGAETFNDSINDQWIVSKIKKLYKVNDKNLL